MTPFFFLALLYILNAFVGALATGGASSSSAAVPGPGMPAAEVRAADVPAAVAPAPAVPHFGAVVSPDAELEASALEAKFVVVLHDRLGIAHPNVGPVQEHGMTRKLLIEELSRYPTMPRFLYLGHTWAGPPEMILATPLAGKSLPEGRQRVALLSFNREKRFKLRGVVWLKEAQQLLSKLPKKRMGHDRMAIEPGFSLNLEDALREVVSVRTLW